MPKSTKDAWVDPTTIRMSEHFLLSDFLGCYSAYRKGLPNLFCGDEGKLREGRTLCNALLEPLLRTTGLSISYGYISPELSRQVVKYQDPDKPSYHRWDFGAACDVVLHDSERAPIYDAVWMDENLPTSRLITYSESPFICVGTRHSEVHMGDPRRALYENRYTGVAKARPEYINYSGSAKRRIAMKEAIELEHDWRGGGFPSYHGGGILQYQHVRTSRYTLLSDFLYNTTAVADGIPNPPAEDDMAKFVFAGRLIDTLLAAWDVPRVSIVRGYENPEWSDTVHTWRDGIYLVLVAPGSVDPREAVRVASSVPGVRRALLGSDHRIYIDAEMVHREGAKEVQHSARPSTATTPSTERRRTRRNPRG